MMSYNWKKKNSNKSVTTSSLKKKQTYFNLQVPKYFISLLSINYHLTLEADKWNAFQFQRNNLFLGENSNTPKNHEPARSFLISCTVLCIYLCLLIPFSWISVSPLCFPVLLLWCGFRSSISATLWFASENSPEELSESKPVWKKHTKQQLFEGPYDATEHHSHFTTLTA